MVIWLIVTHHRLPFLYEKEKYSDIKRQTISEMLKSITSSWGYKNETDEDRLKKCFEFPEGLISQSNQWLKQIKKWSARLLQSQVQIQQLIENDSYRLLLHHSRLCLMLGDHYYGTVANPLPKSPLKSITFPSYFLVINSGYS